MELIDTHAHLDYPDFEADLEGVIARATEAGVTRIITIGTGLESSRRAVMLSERFPNVFAVVGVHPNNVAEEGLDFLPTLRELATHPKVKQGSTITTCRRIYSLPRSPRWMRLFWPSARTIRSASLPRGLGNRRNRMPSGCSWI